MTSPQTPAGMTSVRGLGWDIDSSVFGQSRRPVSGRPSYGHTGFTGTSLWIDPTSNSYVIFLSSRLHPDGTGDVGQLRSKVATVAAAARSCGERSQRPPIVDTARTNRRVERSSNVAGLDRHRCSRSRRLQRLCAASASDSSPITPAARADGTSTIDLLHSAPGVRLVALFSPEHGIRGILDANVPAERDEKTGLAIHSLYGDTRRPTDAMLAGIDTLVIDLQDVGVRFYTYQTTMAYVMEEAAKRKIAVVVLDRPNPVNGWQIEGPMSAPSAEFISYFEMPVRHGMTMGELARLFNEERKIQRRPHRDPARELDARRLVRRNGPRVDQSVAEHAQPESGDALSRHRRDRVLERLGRPRHRSAVRAGWRAMDRRSAARCRSQCAEVARHSFLSDRLHAKVEQVRKRRVPGRVHGDHGPQQRCGPCASGSRSPRRCRRSSRTSSIYRRALACLAARSRSTG